MPPEPPPLRPCRPERAKYDELHAAARRTYEATYANHGDAYISSKILSVMALLMPLRRLCSGGSPLPAPPRSDPHDTSERVTAHCLALPNTLNPDS